MKLNEHIEEEEDNLGKYKIPCGCPKGGLYENEDGSTFVCEKCDGSQYVLPDDIIQSLKSIAYKSIDAVRVEELQKKIEEITDEYGQLHEMNCDLNNEDGSWDGCDCPMRALMNDIILLVASAQKEKEYKDE